MIDFEWDEDKDVQDMKEKMSLKDAIVALKSGKKVKENEVDLTSKKVSNVDALWAQTRLSLFGPLAPSWGKKNDNLVCALRCFCTIII